jgi:hypothetical protein
MHQALGEERHIESTFVVAVLFGCQQVEQQRGDAVLIQYFGDVPIARA